MDIAFLLIVQIMFADKPPMRHEVIMPDQEVCLKEAEEFLNKFEPPPNAVAIATNYTKKMPKQEKS